MATITTAAATGTYRIDTAHSEVLFRIRHLLGWVTGRFREFSGTMRFDPSHPADSKAEFTIDAASIDTNTPDRDTHLRSADFFDVEHYPHITFASGRVTPTSPDHFVVSGTLTVRGVSRQIDLPVHYFGAVKDPWGKEKAGFEAVLTLDRKDFGLLWNAPLETGGMLVGDEVTITLNIEAERA